MIAGRPMQAPSLFQQFHDFPAGHWLFYLAYKVPLRVKPRQTNLKAHQDHIFWIPRYQPNQIQHELHGKHYMTLSIKCIKPFIVQKR